MTSSIKTSQFSGDGRSIDDTIDHASIQENNESNDDIVIGVIPQIEEKSMKIEENI